MKPFTIAGVSFWPELWKPEKNLEQLLVHVRRAAEMGAQLIATREGILDGYITRDLEKRRIRLVDKGSKGYAKRLAAFRKKQLALAGRIGEKCIPVLRREAAALGVYLFANTLDRRRGTSVFNTTFVIDAEGKIIGKYDKIHADFEVVNELGRGYPVFETPFAPVGVLICADRQFPEAARSVALAGARVLIVNSYGMWGEGANERFIRQRAYENGVFLLFCHPGESVVVSPEGRIIAATCGWEHVVTRTIDPAESVGRGVFGSRAMARTYPVKGSEKAYGARYAEGLARKTKQKG
jgi:predicted amidohydrolase